MGRYFGAATALAVVCFVAGGSADAGDGSWGSAGGSWGSAGSTGGSWGSAGGAYDGCEPDCCCSRCRRSERQARRAARRATRSASHGGSFGSHGGSSSWGSSGGSASHGSTGSWGGSHGSTGGGWSSSYGSAGSSSYGSYGGGYTAYTASGTGYAGFAVPQNRQTVVTRAVTKVPTPPQPTQYGLLVVHVPNDAKIYHNGRVVSASGEVRQFRVPARYNGQRCDYALKIEVERDGEIVSVSPSGTIEPGKTATVKIQEPATDRLVAVTSL